MTHSDIMTRSDSTDDQTDKKLFGVVVTERKCKGQCLQGTRCTLLDLVLVGPVFSYSVPNGGDEE